MPVVHSNAYFSIADGADSETALRVVREFLAGLQARGLVNRFTVLKNCNAGSKTQLPPFQADIVFNDHEQMAKPFTMVGAEGVHVGDHGAMLAHVGGWLWRCLRKSLP